MLDKVINEAKGAIVAAIQGTDDILSALRGAVRNQVLGTLSDVGDIASTGLDEVAAVEGAVKAAGEVGADTAEAAGVAVTGAVRAAHEVGGEAGTAVRNALLSAASLPREVVEKAIIGSAS